MTAATELDARELLAGRLVDGVTQAMEIFGVYLGVELGLYRALAGLGAATEEELAGHAGVAVRYAREWLEQQAVAGYLVCDDWPYEVPRLDAPRTRVPAGAIALAGAFSGVYPRPSPGGWRLVGRTDALMWDAQADPPALLAPGRRVRFEAVG